MADMIQFYRGKEAKLPVLRPGQPGYCTDTKRLYIGSAAGNVLLADNGCLGRVDALEETMPQKLTASAVAAQDALTAGAELDAVTAKVNALIAAMKASGVMSR